jgi:hypothetical protein
MGHTVKEPNGDNSEYSKSDTQPLRVWLDLFPDLLGWC